MPVNGHRYGWSIVRELWVKLPADGHHYGWSIVREVWVRKPKSEWINGVKWTYSFWDDSLDVDAWTTGGHDSDDSSSDEPPDHQGDADNQEADELEEEGLLRVGIHVVPIPFPRPIFRNV